MLVYLDTCIVIYAVEGQAPFQQRAQSHIKALEAAGSRFLIRDLTRGECLVQPLGKGDATLLLSYQRFFLSQNLSARSLIPFIHDRAARIRGHYRYAGGRIYGLVDSIHLAAAIEFGCDRFLTNDARLSNFPDVYGLRGHGLRGPTPSAALADDGSSASDRRISSLSSGSNFRWYCISRIALIKASPWASVEASCEIMSFCRSQ